MNAIGIQGPTRADRGEFSLRGIFLGERLAELGFSAFQAPDEASALPNAARRMPIW